MPSDSLLSLLNQALLYVEKFFSTTLCDQLVFLSLLGRGEKPITRKAFRNKRLLQDFSPFSIFLANCETAFLFFLMLFFSIFFYKTCARIHVY